MIESRDVVRSDWPKEVVFVHPLIGFLHSSMAKPPLAASAWNAPRTIGMVAVMLTTDVGIVVLVPRRCVPSAQFTDQIIQRFRPDKQALIRLRIAILVE